MECIAMNVGPAKLMFFLDCNLLIYFETSNKLGMKNKLKIYPDSAILTYRLYIKTHDNLATRKIFCC